MNLIKKLVFRKMTPLEQQWLKLRKKLMACKNETCYTSKVEEVLSIVPHDNEELTSAVDYASKLYRFISYGSNLGMSK